MNSFVLANAQHCIGCHACEVACVMAHNGEQHALTTEEFLPRIQVISDGHRANATTCRHCEDAPCVTSCPTNALIHSDGSVQLKAELCIGCKSCVVACPFGSISVQRSPQSLEGAWVPATAHKCDLCREREDGPACVGNCPTGALRLFTPESLTSLRKERINLSVGRETPGAQPRIAHAALPEKCLRLENASQRLDPEKIAIERRVHSFDEIYKTFTAQQSLSQAQRCLGCGKHSQCEWSCPLHNHIPQWIELVKQGRIMEAVELSHQTNPLPEVTGRVCPQDRLCESRCTIKDRAGSVNIGNIERFISDTAFSSGWRPDMSQVKPTDHRVAIVGAGPAGLGCADILARNGIQVTVFDRHPEIGGLLTFGIPSFKLDKKLLTRRREIFNAMGVRFELECEVGKDIEFEALMADFDAVFVGAGTYQSMEAGLENETAPGVYEALPFLIASTRNVMELPDLPDSPWVNLASQRVVVLGGGDTAMDCVRTSIRQGAAEVTCAYRRDEANMPGSKKEVKNAREEGVKFEFNVQPLKIETDESGKVCGVRMLRTQMGEPDEAGRRRPVPVPDSEFVMPADAVIIAFGFNPHPMPWLARHGVTFDSRGRIEANVHTALPYQTRNPRIFAGGDAVRGADLVVTAIAEGRHAAGAILQLLAHGQPRLSA
ncbi:oxidoreductase FeS-binding subunit [Salmonella enterica subsp. enterica serovar Choleraesuis]|nr:oxidoreductase FeS-binding subunit [Salmonella enterica subsp. enterica serovar Choleraesuis]